MPQDVISRHPAVYRLLLRALPIAMMILVTSFAASVWIVTRNNARINHANTRIAALAKEGADAKAGLCASQQNTLEQIEASRAYLADIKAGRRKPIPGISATDIASGLARQQKYVAALDVVHCEVAP